VVRGQCVGIEGRQCKSITFSRLRHPIEFSYILGGIILDRVDSINDLRVTMDNKVYFTGHTDVTVGRALPMLGFVKMLSCEFRDPYTLKALVRPKLEYASCVYRPFYGTHIDRIERVQKKFVWYALRGLGWTDMFDVPPYVNRCVSRHLPKDVLMHASCLFLIFCLVG
jgi:hypothetical protein